MAAQTEEKITACRNSTLINGKSNEEDTAAPPTLCEWHFMQKTDNMEAFYGGLTLSDIWATDCHVRAGLYWMDSVVLVWMINISVCFFPWVKRQTQCLCKLHTLSLLWLYTEVWRLTATGERETEAEDEETRGFLSRVRPLCSLSNQATQQFSVNRTGSCVLHTHPIFFFCSLSLFILSTASISQHIAYSLQSPTHTHTHCKNTSQHSTIRLIFYTVGDKSVIVLTAVWFVPGIVLKMNCNFNSPRF